jgi:replicative DNA helicase
MKLSAPLFQLKRQARILSREEKIPLHEALDRIAVREGFKGWSLLAAKASAMGPAGKLYAQMQPGDLVILGARPGQGKTLMSLEIAVEAMKAGNRSVFFSLEYSDRDYRDRFEDIGVDLAQYEGLFEFDGSESISADHIARRLESSPRGTLVIIDYLQLLDQKRETPPLMVQIRSLKLFARRQGVIMVFISQIDRSYDPSTKPCPELEDVRLPNPLDLKLFDKMCFLNNGQVQFGAVS